MPRPHLGPRRVRAHGIASCLASPRILILQARSTPSHGAARGLGIRVGSSGRSLRVAATMRFATVLIEEVLIETVLFEEVRRSNVSRSFQRVGSLPGVATH
jgi:hypothetical protein